MNQKVDQPDHLGKAHRPQSDGFSGQVFFLVAVHIFINTDISVNPLQSCCKLHVH